VEDLNLLSSLLKVVECVLLATQTQLHMGKAMIKPTSSVLVSIEQDIFVSIPT
jgi:hypothetical protein